MEDITYDPKQSRLAVTSLHGHIKMHLVDRHGMCCEFDFLVALISLEGSLSVLWVHEMRDSTGRPVIAKSVQFHEEADKLLVFGLETGDMYV